MSNPLKEMVYPGRGIVLGNDDNGETFAAYFVTGRSPSSQARRFGQEGTMIFTEPTDPETLAKGNPDLLIYNALVWDPSAGVIAVSNGKQTDTVYASVMCTGQDVIEATRQWNYEPDDPNFTPRISGFVDAMGDETVSQLGLIKRGGDGKAVRELTDLTDELKTGEKGIAFLLTTYRGGNESPLAPYEGVPKQMHVEGQGAGQLCEEVGGMLDPKLVVSVGAVVMNPGKMEYDSAIRNYRE